MLDNFFIKELGFSEAVQKPHIEATDLVNKFGLDSVHYSGNFPAVFFKQVESFNIESLKTIAELQRKIWNNSRVSFLYVSSSSEIRIYNCNESPVILNRENSEDELPYELNKRVIESCACDDINKLELLKQVFSSVAIDSGSIWMSNYSTKVKLQTKVDHFLVGSLLALAKAIRKDINDDTIIHHLLMRCIFIMYLQDRQAIPREIWERLGTYDFLELLGDKDKTYELFDEIQLHFNGNVFPITSKERTEIDENHLLLIKNCLTDGDIDLSQQKLFNWRVFDFSYIRIELLSEIYERFLAEFDPVKKKQTGTYYTPPSLVELVLDDVLPKGGTMYNLKVLDPACGSGIFLAQAYKRIVEYWKNAHKKDPDFKTLVHLLTNSIYGVEIDNKSIKVASFSLYLALLDFLSPRDVWLKNGEKFPYLINDSEVDIESGENLHRCDTIEHGGTFENKSYDIVVGNPPFGANGLSENIKKYCQDLGFNAQYVIPFIHKSAKLLKKNGKVAMLFNTKLLTNSNTKAKNFRNWLFNENYVEKVYNLSILRKSPKNFGGHLFSSAVVPVSIMSFRKEAINKVDTIEYWAPKTFIKHHVVDGVIIDSVDIKYLPREICNKPDSKIWKIAQWGTMADFHLMERLLSYPSILECLEDDNHGVGFQTIDGTTERPIPNNNIGKLPFILPEHIEQFYTKKDRTYSIKKSLKTVNSSQHYQAYPHHDDSTVNVFRRLGKVNAYNAPHILVKEGLLKNRVCASYLDYDCTFNSKVYGIHHKDESFLKTLTCLLNSDFGMYFLFLHSSSLGIEREEIKPTDVKRLPQVPKEYWGKFEKICNSLIAGSDDLLNDSSNLHNRVNQLICESLQLTGKDLILIEDFYNYTLPLFFEGAKAKSLFPIDNKGSELVSYSAAISGEINNFLSNNGLYLNPTVYIPNVHSPLVVVVLKFEGEKKKLDIVKSNTDMEQQLFDINNYTIQSFSQSVFVRKQVRYYDEDKIIIVRPNQKRYWSRSQGLDDALSIINEIMSFKS